MKPFSRVGSLDSKIILWYTKDWNHMNIIDVEALSPILCIDVSVDGTFLVAGKNLKQVSLFSFKTYSFLIHYFTYCLTNICITFLLYRVKYMSFANVSLLFLKKFIFEFKEIGPKYKSCST